MIKDKYIIFLNESYFNISTTNCFSCIKPVYNIVQELQNTGITVMNFNDIQANSRVLINPEHISMVNGFKQDFERHCNREPTMEELINNLGDIIEENDIKKILDLNNDNILGINNNILRTETAAISILSIISFNLLS